MTDNFVVEEMRKLQKEITQDRLAYCNRLADKDKEIAQLMTKVRQLEELIDLHTQEYAGVTGNGELYKKFKTLSIEERDRCEHGVHGTDCYKCFPLIK